MKIWATFLQKKKLNSEKQAKSCSMLGLKASREVFNLSILTSRRRALHSPFFLVFSIWHRVAWFFISSRLAFLSFVCLHVCTLKGYCAAPRGAVWYSFGGCTAPAGIASSSSFHSTVPSSSPCCTPTVACKRGRISGTAISGAYLRFRNMDHELSSSHVMQLHDIFVVPLCPRFPALNFCNFR